MKDDRLVTRSAALTTIMTNEINKVIGLNRLTWERLHLLGGGTSTAMEMRQLGCRAALCFGALVRV